MAQLDNGYGLPPEYQPQIQDISRQLKLADMLRQQSQEPLQGQMVSGRYVAPSITQQLSKALSGYAANKKEESATNAQNKLYKDYQGNISTQTQRLADALKPKQVADGYNTTPPERQFDQFGSPVQGQDMTPIQGEQKFKEVQPTQQDISTAMLNYYSGIGHPELGAQYLGKQAELQQQQGFKTQETQAQHEFLQQQAQQQREERMQELQLRLQDSRTSAQDRAELQKQLAQMQIDSRKELAQFSKQNGGQPYFQPVQTAQGVMAFNARTGKMEPVSVNGGAVIGAQADPTLQGKISNAKESGKVTGESSATAQVNLPQTIAQAQNSVKLVDDLLAHPGFNKAVGMGSLNPLNMLPGEARDFNIRLDQIKGQQFMQAYQNLKGGGQITEVEGKKATDAISRMNNSSTKQEFIKAAREFQDVIRAGVSRAQQRAGAVPAQHPILDAADAIIGGGR